MKAYICKNCGQDEYGFWNTRWTSKKEEKHCIRCHSEDIKRNIKSANRELYPELLNK